MQFLQEYYLLLYKIMCLCYFLDTIYCVYRQKGKKRDGKTVSFIIIYNIRRQRATESLHMHLHALL